VLGDPIAHSLSPVLHRAGYAALGLDWAYDAHRVPAAGLRTFLADVVAADANWRGLSLTMPLKREALGLADIVSDRAVAAGAANTLVLDRHRILADNTDVPGALAAIREHHAHQVRSASILGGGATAGSVLLALAESGCRQFQVHVRNAARAAQTLAVAERFSDSLKVTVVGLEEPPVGELLVSTIPASAQTPDLAARAARLPVVFDVIYDPWPTPIAAAGIASGAIVVGGLDLLVHQAALQFSIFTDLPAPLAAMRRAGVAAAAGSAQQN
jgi:shikimate dehydrogenase